MRRRRRLAAGSVGADGDDDADRPEALTHQWQAGEVSLAQARTLVSGWLRHRCITGLEPSLHLAVTELLSNAREASQTGDPVLLRMEDDGSTVNVEVQNKGERFEPSFDMPDALASRGRGLSLVSAMADSIEIDHALGRTRVVVRFSLE